jgi:hypothetical protein
MLTPSFSNIIVSSDRHDPKSRPVEDTAQAFKFLKLIDPRATTFTFQTFREKGDTESSVEPKVIHSDSLTELHREHVTGAGIYLTVNETDGRGRRAENIVRIRAVFQEGDNGFDGPFPIPPSLAIETSPQHHHRYWLVADDWPADGKGRADFTSVMERMIASYGSDPVAKDISRVLRVPGFWHRKGAPFMVRIVEASGQRYTRAEIVAVFPSVPREPIKVREWKPCADGWLRGLIRAVANASEGHRNATLFWATCRAGEAVRDGKASEAFVVDVLIEAATHAGLPEREAQRTVQSGIHRT